MVQILAIFGAKYLFILPLVIFVIYVFKIPRFLQKRVLVLSAISSVLTFLAVFLLGILYYNPRPFMVLGFDPLVFHIPDNGFPSEHAVYTALIASIVYSFNPKAGTFLFFVSIIISLSRVYAGVYHIVDIIAGILLAIVMTYLAQIIIEKFFPSPQKQG